MNHEKFSEALGEISPALIEEAAQVYEKNGHRKARVLRVAAIAAVLAILLTALSFWPAREESYITGPGLLVVRAYGAEDDRGIPMTGVVLEKGISLNVSSWNMLSNKPGISLQLSLPEKNYNYMDISYEITLSNGSFFRNSYPYDTDGNLLDAYERRKSGYLGNHFTVNNEATIYFQPFTRSFDDETKHESYTWYTGEQVFAKIVIYAGKHIVGYAVIVFQSVIDPSVFESQPDLKQFDQGMVIWSAYEAQLLEAVSFPLVKGSFQNVSKDYVEKQLERICA